MNASESLNEDRDGTTTPPLPYLKFNDTPVFFNEDWDIGIGGGLWSTGLAMAKYFQHNSLSIRQSLVALLADINRTGRKTAYRSSNRKSNRGMSALELGSGNGFLSICLAAVASDILDELVITDIEDHLALIEKTVLANSHITSLHQEQVKENKEFSGDSKVIMDDTISAGGDDSGKDDAMNHDFEKVNNNLCCHIMEHRWGEFNCHNTATLDEDRSDGERLLNLTQKVKDGTKKFDFIFGSDVAYRDHLHSPLIASLEKFSHQHTISIIGVTMSDTKPMFFASLQKAGFRYDRIADHLMSSEFRGTTFGLFVIQKQK